jgi:hypothetical protein
MTSKIIIISVIILLLASFSILFIVEKLNDNYDYKKSWTVVYFNNPNDNSLNFTIENHQGAKGEYAYDILAASQNITKGTAQIEAGGKKEINPDLNLEKIMQQAPVRISVDINLGDLKYNIYKNIK